MSRTPIIRALAPALLFAGCAQAVPESALADLRSRLTDSQRKEADGRFGIAGMGKGDWLQAEYILLLHITERVIKLQHQKLRSSKNNFFNQHPCRNAAQFFIHYLQEG